MFRRAVAKAVLAATAAVIGPFIRELGKRVGHGDGEAGPAVKGSFHPPPGLGSRGRRRHGSPRGVVIAEHAQKQARGPGAGEAAGCDQGRDAAEARRLQEGIRGLHGGEELRREVITTPRLRERGIS